MPAVGATVDMVTCQPGQSFVGMWLGIQNFGALQIVAITGGGKTLTLRNGCSNGAAVPGNIAPGEFVSGQISWHPVQAPECDLGFDSRVIDALEDISATNPLCFTNPPIVADNESMWDIGVTAACDPGDCEPQSDPYCFKISKFIRKFSNTFRFINRLKTIDPKGINDDRCKISGPVIESVDGELVRPLNALTYFAAGNNSQVILKQDEVGPTNTFVGLIFSLDLGPHVPECAKRAKLRGWLRLDTASGGSNGLRGNLFVTGPGVAPLTGSHKLAFIDTTSSADVEFSFTWNIEVSLQQNNKVANHTVQILSQLGTGHYYSYGAYLEGYYM